MKALSLWQPWASLVAVGRKRIETRSWQTSYRGPLAIHAAGRRPRPGECPGEMFVNGIGELTYLLPEPWTEEDQVAAGLPPDGDLIGFPLPVGAVVATATLVDCAPMGGWDSFSTGIVEGGEPDFAGRHVLVIQPDGDLTLDHPPGCGHEVGTAQDVTDQAPYGDFRYGRWAWILDDVRYVHPSTPARGRQGLWTWEP